MSVYDIGQNLPPEPLLMEEKKKNWWGPIQVKAPAISWSLSYRLFQSFSLRPPKNPCKTWISFVISQLYHIFENFCIPYVSYSTIFQPNANQPIRFNRNWSRIGKYYQLMTNMNVLTIIDRPANLFPFWTNPIKIDQFTDINCQFGAIEHNET